METTLIALGALLLFSGIITGVFIKKKGWAFVKGDPAFVHIRMFTMAFMVLIILIGFLHSRFAEASDLKFLQYIQVDVAVDVPLKIRSWKSPQCMADSFDTRLTSDGRFILNILKYDWVEINGYYLHKSCAIGTDDEVYDAVGGSLSARFDNPWF